MLPHLSSILSMMQFCSVLAVSWPQDVDFNRSHPQWQALRRTDEVPVNFHFHGFSNDKTLEAAKQGTMDMVQLANSALSAADKTSSSFLRYFQKEDLDSVLEVFDRILAECALAHSPDMQIIDFYFDTWDKLPSKTAKCKDKNNLLAVSIEGVVTAQDKNIILCAELFRYFSRPLSEISCDSLKDTATYTSMDTIGSSILHEMLHFGSLLRRSIDDLTVKVDGLGDVPGYGPYGAMMVNRIDGLGILNADNYVWFALETWFMNECGITEFKDPPVKVIQVEL